jgi:hypothetical protein
MKIAGTLCILPFLAVTVTSMAAEQQTKARCLPGLVKVTAAVASAVYDGPGGGKIGYRVPGASDFLVESRGREIRDLWHLLDVRGRAHMDQNFGRYHVLEVVSAYRAANKYSTGATLSNAQT